MSKMLRHEFYVILECTNPHGYPKLTAKKVLNRTEEIPACDTDQIPLLVTVELPLALFERPELCVKVSVPADVPRVDIDAGVQETLTERIQEIIGLPTTITVDLPDESGDG